MPICVYTPMEWIGKLDFDRGVHGYIMGIHGPISAYKGIQVCMNICLNKQKNKYTTIRDT